MTAASGAVGGARARPGDAIADWFRHNAWTLGLLLLLAALFLFTKTIQPSYGPPGIQSIASAVLPLALAAVGQAIVVTQPAQPAAALRGLLGL